LGMMPKDAEMVMGIDFASLRSSALYKQYAPMLQAAAGSKLSEFKDMCGFDPFEQIGTITVAVKGDKSDQDLTALITGFSKDKVVDCVKKAAAKDGKSDQVKIDGDYIEATTPKGQVGLLFVGDGILVHKTASGFATKDALVAQSKQAA